MDTTYLIELFEKNKRFHTGSKIQRLTKSPVKLICSKVLQLFAEAFNKPIKFRAKTFWNDDIAVVIPDIVSLTIYRYTFFEDALTNMILHYLKPGMTFFDIGAHLVYFTLLGSAIIGNSGQVHSFEPTTSTFEILKSNVSKKQNVFLNNCAVLSRRKIVFINDYGIKYCAFNSIYNARLPKNILTKLKVKKYKVESISIDDYVEKNGVIPDFIKIDAENSEYEILLGMEKTIHKFHPIISIEIGDINVNGTLESRDLINFLTNKGYKPHEFRDQKILPHSFRDEKYQPSPTFTSSK